MPSDMQVEQEYFDRINDLELWLDDVLGDDDESRVTPLDPRRVAVRIEVLEQIRDAVDDTLDFADVVTGFEARKGSEWWRSSCCGWPKTDGCGHAPGCDNYGKTPGLS